MQLRYLFIFLLLLNLPSVGQNHGDTIEEVEPTISPSKDITSTQLDPSIQLIKKYARTNIDSSIIIYEEVIFQIQEESDSEKFLDIQTAIFQVLINKGEYSHLKRLLEKDLAYGHQSKDNQIICSSLMNLANLSWVLSNLETTLLQLEEASNYAEQLQNLSFKARIINGFGILYGEMGESQKAFQYFKQHYDISKQQGDISDQAVALNNIVRVFINQKKYEEAQSYLAQVDSILVFEKLKQEFPMLHEFLLAKKGEVLIGLGQQQLGLTHLESALEQATSNQHARAVIKFSSTKASILLDLQKFDEAIKTAKIGVEKAKETGYIKELPELCRLLSELYKVKGDYQSALTWMEEEKKTNTEVAERQRNNEVIKLEAKFALQEIESENKILQLKNKNQRILLAFVVALCALATLFLFYFFRKRNQKKLELLRQKIAADLHDDVGGNLSNITRIAKGLKTSSNTNELNSGIDQLVKKSNEAIRNVIDVIWTLDNDENELGYLIEKMESYLDEVKATNTEVKINFQTNNLDEKKHLKIDERHHLLMIFKEALNNIQKHTESFLIDIELSRINQKFRMNILNQYHTKVISNSSTGRGLENIQKRINDLGGHLKIQEKENSFTLQIVLNNF